MGDEALLSVWSGLAAAVRRQQGPSRGTTVYTPLEGEGEKEFIARLYAEPTALPHRLWRKFQPRFVKLHGAGAERRGSTDSAVSEGSEETEEGSVSTPDKSRAASAELGGGVQDGAQAEGEGEGEKDRGSLPAQEASLPTQEANLPTQEEASLPTQEEANLSAQEASLPTQEEANFPAQEANLASPGGNLPLPPPTSPPTPPHVNQGVHGSALQDVRGMVHELVLGMLECHPPWRGQATSVERVLAFVEAAVLGDPEVRHS